MQTNFIGFGAWFIHKAKEARHVRISVFHTIKYEGRTRKMTLSGHNTFVTNHYILVHSLLKVAHSNDEGTPILVVPCASREMPSIRKTKTTCGYHI